MTVYTHRKCIVLRQRDWATGITTRYSTHYTNTGQPISSLIILMHSTRISGKENINLVSHCLYSAILEANLQNGSLSLPNLALGINIIGQGQDNVSDWDIGTLCW